MLLVRRNEALLAYDRLRRQGARPSIGLVLDALKACTGCKDVQSGSRIHRELVASGDSSNIFVANTLVDMYARCGHLEEARLVFESIQHKNVVSWNCLITGYAQRGRGRAALDLYSRMRDEGWLPDVVTVLAALKACVALAEEEKQCQRKLKQEPCPSLVKGRQIHAQAARGGQAGHICVANTLVDMYSKCGSLAEAVQVFEAMPRRDAVSWNCVLMGCVQNGEGELALSLYDRMRDQGGRGNSIATLAAFMAVSSLAEAAGVAAERQRYLLEQGRRLHGQAVREGVPMNAYLETSLVDMYGKCGSPAEARQVFDGMQQPRRAVSWNCMLMGYALSGDGSSALQLYASMQLEGCVPDPITLVAAFKACGILGSLRRARAIHQHAMAAGRNLINSVVAATLVDMYAKCSSMSEARDVFESAAKPSIVCWNCIIMGYANAGQGWLALELYDRMQKEAGLEPSRVTYVAALKACTSLAEQTGDSDRFLQVHGKGKEIHARASTTGHASDLFVASTLVDMYANCGCMEDAREVFQGMEQRNQVSWNAMILGYAQNGEGERALDLFQRMHEEGGSAAVPDQVSYVAALKACSSLADKEEPQLVHGKLMKLGSLNKGREVHRRAAVKGHDGDMFVASTLVDVYAKCSSMVEARRVFEAMSRRNVVAWTAIILGYVQDEQPGEALRLYARMQDEGCQPNEVTLVAVLKACASTADLEAGRRIHMDLSVAGLEDDVILLNALVDFYGRCGSMGEAKAVFDRIPASKRSSAAWGALTAGYSRQGDTASVFKLLEAMRKEETVQPDEGTLLAVLAACSHSGNVEEGERLLAAMSSEYGITPKVEHYNCVVDTLGRANRLKDAVAMVKRMDTSANEVTWMVLMAAACKWKNAAVGKLAFDSLVKTDGQNAAAAYVMMSNIYTGLGMVDEAQALQKTAPSGR